MPVVTQQGFQQAVSHRYRKLHRLAHRQVAHRDLLHAQNHHAATFLDIQYQPLIVQVKEIAERFQCRTDSRLVAP
ncbi:hypothetical protein D3C75_1216260 [compost metagenome]